MRMLRGLLVGTRLGFSNVIADLVRIFLALIQGECDSDDLGFLMITVCLRLCLRNVTADRHS